MSFSSKYRLTAWWCLVCAVCLGAATVVPCQALEDSAPRPQQLSQTDPAYVQLMTVLVRMTVLMLTMTARRTV